MSSIRVLAGVLLGASILLAAGCGGNRGEGGAPPSLMRPVIQQPWGTRADFRDEDRQYVIFLNDDNTYLYEAMPLYGTVVEEVRNGTWKWRVKNDREAELLLDSEKFELQFVSPESAMAMSETRRRSFVFNFHRVGGNEPQF